jgi:hypothetical protein
MLLTKAELINELDVSSRLSTFVPVYVELNGKKVLLEGAHASAIIGKTYAYVALPRNSQELYTVDTGKATPVKANATKTLNEIADELDPEPDEVIKANAKLAEILGSIPKGYTLHNGKLIRNRALGEAPKPRAARGSGKARGTASENGTFKADAVGMKIVRTNDNKTLTVKSVSPTGKAVLDDGTEIGRLNRYYKRG